MTEDLDFSRGRSSRSIAAGREVCSRIILHSQFVEALKGCADIVLTSAALQQPAGVLVQADSGMGKTVLLNVLCQRMPNVVRVDLDSTVNTMSLASAVLQAFDFPALPTRQKQDTINAMVDRALSRAKPVALVMDEFQHIFEGNRDITATHCTDWLKIRMDKHCMGFIGVGTTGANKASIVNKQFVSRASALYEIKGFALGSGWRKLLAGFCVNGNIVNFDILKGPISAQVHKATNGNMRALRNLLAFAACAAAEREDGSARLEDFSRAFAEVNGKASDRANPFTA